MNTTYVFVDFLELPRPSHVVQKWAMVVAMIVRTVRLRVIGRRQYGHLVAIDSVGTIEMLHFRCHLQVRANLN